MCIWKHGDRCKPDTGGLFTASGSVRFSSETFRDTVFNEVVHAVEHEDVSVRYIEGEVPSRIVEISMIGAEELVIVTSDRGFSGATPRPTTPIIQQPWHSQNGVMWRHCRPHSQRPWLSYFQQVALPCLSPGEASLQN